MPTLEWQFGHSLTLPVSDFIRCHQELAATPPRFTKMSYEWLIAFGGVFLLGVQTSISPCPLTTNIAAISYITRRAGNSRTVLFSGGLYTLGRVLVYLVLAIAILSALFAGGEAVTRFLQTQIHGYLGPVLIVVGMLLLGMISLPLGSVSGERAQRLADALGIWSALPLGAIFALAFCPTSAATFLAMVTFAAQFQSNVAFPVVFGVGTAVPVLIVAGVIAVNASLLGRAFAMMQTLDWWTRTITGTLFIVIGIWFSLKYVYGVL
ncbi:MAG: aromatic aminobenezylarsenical efflux permease ArsG family transporter [Thermoguttaceae bacterium]